MSGRKGRVAEEKPVVGIPLVVVVEPVDVGIPLAVVVAVGVEHLYLAPSVTPPIEFSLG